MSKTSPNHVPPGQASQTADGEASQAKPQQASDTAPQQASGTAPGQASGTAPGQASGTAPGQASDTAPGQASDTAPGQASDTAPGQASGTAGQGEQADQKTTRGAGLARLVLMSGLITALLIAAVVSSVYLVTRHDQTSASNHLLRPSGIPASISTSLANLMALSPVPPKPAPGFTLTDQRGRTVTLSSLRGKVVVLEFMDPHCTDICPIVSNEFVRAYHDLGPLASKVVFAAVNVNQYYATINDVAMFSRGQQLTSIPSWHFFTGPVPALRSVWSSYDIAVQAPNPNADIVHTSAVYFIDSQGRERYLAEPMVDHSKSGASYLPADQIVSWGRGIALVARDMAK